MDTEMIDWLLSNSIPEPNSGCYLWLGGASGSGYGQTYIDGERCTTHVLMCEAVHGPMGDNYALHKCDVKLCCNPDHVYPGTSQDNMNDRAARNDCMKGENHPLSTVPDTIVEQIRAAVGTQRDIAAEFGVSQSYVSMVRSGARRGGA